MLIGLTGYAGVGKDAFADAIVASDYRFIKLGFADPMYKMAESINPLIELEIGVTTRLSSILEYVRGDWVRAKTERGVREFLQCLGESGRQFISPGVWVDALKAKIDLTRNTVITNVRHENEAEMVKSLGGVIVKIERDGYGPVNGHVSDQGLAFKYADCVVRNSGSRQELAATAIELVASRL